MKIDRAFTCIQSNDVNKTADVLRKLLGYTDAFVSDWFVHLCHPSNKSLELGILPKDAKILPAEFHGVSQQVMLTFTTDSADAAFEQAKDMGLKIVEEPRDLFYGQRRLLIEETNSGVLLDISSECPPSQEFLDSLQS